ncbi:MAG: trehalose-binding protein [Deltaproteobacteria bacterium]|uniref:FmdE family protein n=1 Tax=Desulfobacula sp. TaxID=2593537 RepID=UPI0019CE1109|nr:trehalose-binding protein [Candidatus Desulfobacula maris]MBL6995744.1 trehalose-binding protein [Desulfobacula sp.]
MNIVNFTFDAFLKQAADFSGKFSPGLLIGGYMVEEAKKKFPEKTPFQVIAETPKSLPDAIGLLTPCTIGNGGLKLVNLGRYALCFYNSATGNGVRVYLDSEKLRNWPEIKGWLFKLTPAQDYNMEKLIAEIHRAGSKIFGFESICVRGRFLKGQGLGKIVICAVCGEAFPESDGGICRGCRNESPYSSVQKPETPEETGPSLKKIAVEDVVGKIALHDMTKIEPGVFKGPEIEFGQKISAGDICRLQKMGKNSIFVADDLDDQNWVHENDAVLSFAKKMAGEGISYEEKPEEGKITFTATRNGLLVINRQMLRQFNFQKDVMCATRHGNTVVAKGKPVAGSRAIPLFISRDRFDTAMTALEGAPLLSVLPLRRAKVGILVTGTEVFNGLVKDRFIPIVKSKVEKLGGEVAGQIIVPDDRQMITKSVDELINAGADLVVTTAGMSVDPDDVTRPALMDAGLTNMVYGTPVLPGTMTLVGKIKNVQVIGVPACALYFNITSFDLLLPRLLAGLEITRADMSEMGEGGMCQNCRLCTYPKCSFGK